MNTSLMQTAAWRRLTELAKSSPAIASQSPDLTLPFADRMLFDFSRWPISDDVLKALLHLARQEDLSGFIEHMFHGRHLNDTEDRAVLHVALRHQGEDPLPVDGDVMPQVHNELVRMYEIAEDIRSGDWLGATGQKIDRVINIGIGGSDLGPRLVVDALEPLADGPAVHFVSNVDSADMNRALDGALPATTLFIVVSKTFTTQETMANATWAREWITSALGPDAIARHFIAVSTNAEAVAAFGITDSNRLIFWDWVGGRFSLWSACGLAIAIANGPDQHGELLAGAAAMDSHWRNAPLEENIPVLAALHGLYQVSFRRVPVLACLPYDQHLNLLPVWLQQVDMESNGKRVTRDGVPIDYPVGHVVFGAAGTNGQHSFHQYLHQGLTRIAMDVILVADSPKAHGDHRRLLLANGLAQSWAFARGIHDVPPQSQCPGRRPVSTILMDRLDPFTLGALLSFYEARVATQGHLWRINSFDQFGVELGKQLARTLVPSLTGGPAPADLDAAGQRQLDWLKARAARPVSD